MNRQIDVLVMTSSIFHMEEKNQEIIRKTYSEVNLTVINQEEATEEMIDKAEIIFGCPRVDFLAKARNLKWLQLHSAGADRYANKDYYCNKEVRVTNMSGVFGLPIAEHVFAMMLSFNRNLQEYAYQKLEHRWNGIDGTRDFYGATLGIIGLGDIGNEIAKRAKAFGARVLAVKRTKTDMPEYVDELYLTENMDEVLKQSDYVVLALPSTGKTKGIITEEKLRIMKPGAFLVNIGRGALIDQDALIKALSEHWIAGAGIDVTTPEPLPQDSKLWDAPNLILTPHTSGGSPTNDQRRFNIFIENLNHYLKNETLKNVVDFKEGY